MQGGPRVPARCGVPARSCCEPESPHRAPPVHWPPSRPSPPVSGAVYHNHIRTHCHARCAVPTASPFLQTCCFLPFGFSCAIPVCRLVPGQVTKPRFPTTNRYGYTLGFQPWQSRTAHQLGQKCSASGDGQPERGQRWISGDSAVRLMVQARAANSACSSLCDPEELEHGNFGNVQDEGKDRCRHEYFSHQKYRQRSHSDSESRQR